MNRSLTAAEEAALPVARAVTSGLASVADEVVFNLSAAGLLRDPAASAAPLPEIRARLAGTWRGPWTVRGLAGTPYLEIATPDGPVAHVNVHLSASAEFIAAAPQDVRVLLDEIDRLQAEISGTAAAEALAGVHPQECEAGLHRPWLADGAEGPLPCPWCRIAQLEAGTSAGPFWALLRGRPLAEPYATQAAARICCETEFRSAYPGMACEWLPGTDDPTEVELATTHRGHTSATGYTVRSVLVRTAASATAQAVTGR